MTESLDKKVWQIALRILGASAKSRCELQEKLRRKGIPSGTVTTTLDRLESYGFLNDQRLAEDLIARFSRNWGMKRLAFECKRRGIAAGIYQPLLSGLRGIPAEAAGRLAEEKWRKLEKFSPAERRKKIYAFLARRGFDAEEVREALRRLPEEQNHEDWEF